MLKKVKHLHISIELEEEDSRKYEEDHTDVVVVMESGEKFAASFFAYKNIDELKKENQDNGEFLAGLFFWAPSMLLVEDCSRKTIQTVVDFLLDEGDFDQVFKRV